jgi:hypothetical protein
MGADPKRAGGPPALAELQRVFQSGVIGGDRAIEDWVAGSNPAQARERFDVYRHAYYARLTEVLQADFKALQAYLGVEQFSAMVRTYANAHPSRHPSIRWFGRGLAGFLAKADPYQSDPLLAEIAAFEWVLSLAFDAPDAPAVTLDDMAALSAASWPASRIQFHPSVQRLDLCFNVPAFWRTVVKEGATAGLQRGAHARPWVVWRRGTTPHYRSLEGDEKIAMDALRNGATFEQSCEDLCQLLDEEQVPFRFASLLKGWITEELVAGISAD